MRGWVAALIVGSSLSSLGPWACAPAKQAGGANAANGSDAADPPYAPTFTLPAWMTSASVFVSGHNVTSEDCRTQICRHNENVDMIVWKGATYLVHRTAISQTLGPNSALHIYRSTGGPFTETARIEAPSDRDIRDPHFFVVGDTLHIKALTRLEVISERDSNVDTVAMDSNTTDGATFSPLAAIGPRGWSFWRIKQREGTYYSAAYQDGDKSVVLYSSKDGATWTPGATIYSMSADTPLETELTFMPSGRMLALVRMDGLENELLGDEGRLRTKQCWSMPPYTTFDCPAEFTGQRLDGPLSVFVGDRMFVIARKHLQGTGKKRTAMFEIGGTLEGGPLTLTELGVIPSAGDTSYAGIAFGDPTRPKVATLSWYSGDLDQDRPWILGMFDITDIWMGTIEF
jgi:hypothetical protein